MRHVANHFHSQLIIGRSQSLFPSVIGRTQCAAFGTRSAKRPASLAVFDKGKDSIMRITTNHAEAITGRLSAHPVKPKTRKVLRGADHAPFAGAHCGAR